MPHFIAAVIVGVVGVVNDDIDKNGSNFKCKKRWNELLTAIKHIFFFAFSFLK